MKFCKFSFDNLNKDKLSVFFVISSFLIYSYITLSQLADFPINFFSDEAIQTVQAEALVKNGFKDAQGRFFPTFFQVAWNWNISLSVYLQVPIYMIFGKSITATRAICALVCLLTPLYITLLLRDIFRVSWWWSGVLVLALMPTWFLHSRTALECSLTAPFLAGFMWCYAKYRLGEIKYLYGAIVFAALTFYSRSAAQGFILFCGILLLFSDLTFHWRNRKTIGVGLILVIILALPYVRFRLQNPDVIKVQFEKLDSYLVQVMPREEKVKIFLEKYWQGLSPQYWFFSDDELVRHRLKGYGHIQPLFFIPFLIGLLIAIKNITLSHYRLLLITLLVSPITSALIEIMVGRIITYFVPAAILIVIGLEAIKNLVVRLVKVERVLAFGCFISCSIMSLRMFQDAINNGPTWFSEYTLYGMQWGAKELFEKEIPEYLSTNPNVRLYLSPDWANGTDVFLSFFSLPRKIGMVSLSGYILHKGAIPENSVFIVTPEEYKRVVESNKFLPPIVDRVLKYPNGENGFYFIRIKYLDNVDQVFLEEKERRKQLVSAEVTMNVAGMPEKLSVKHSVLDMGEIANAFDNNENSLARGMEANPFILSISFEKPRRLRTVSVTILNNIFLAKVQCFNLEGKPSEVLTMIRNKDRPKVASVEFPSNIENINECKIQISNPSVVEGEQANIHVVEVNFDS
jgi:Dolichyl-phosphate-mannose-protein mannosyltransferase